MGFRNILTFRSEKEQQQRTLRSICPVQGAAKGWRPCFKTEVMLPVSAAAERRGRMVGKMLRWIWPDG